MRRLAITLALLALAGCRDEGAADEPPGKTPPATRACTEIGCNDVAEVRFAGLPRGRLRIRMCADERCEHCPPVCRSVQARLDFAARALF